MQSVELEIDEKSHVGAMFMADVAREIRRALINEKRTRKVTQQAIAEKIGTSRSVVNREVTGVENLTVRRVAELLWAIGWEPHFQARKVETEGQNSNRSRFAIASDSTGGNQPKPVERVAGFAIAAE